MVICLDKCQTSFDISFNSGLEADNLEIVRKHAHLIWLSGKNLIYFTHDMCSNGVNFSSDSNVLP